ncbi:MAG: hypothetical protein ACPGJS_05220 [Flammeovirgaceae bacterium]
MENHLLSRHIEGLASKLTTLMEQYVRMQNELKLLRQENEELKDVIESQAVKLKDFQYQEEISKIVSSVVFGSENPEDLKERIDIYIKDIDHCISFLNKEL